MVHILEVRENSNMQIFQKKSLSDQYNGWFEYVLGWEEEVQKNANIMEVQYEECLRVSKHSDSKPKNTTIVHVFSLHKLC